MKGILPKTLTFLAAFLTLAGVLPSRATDNLSLGVPGGVCGDCLRNLTIEEMIATERFAKLLMSQTRAVVLIKTAEAKEKVDDDFCLEDFLDDYGLQKIYEDSREGVGK